MTKNRKLCSILIPMLVSTLFFSAPCLAFAQEITYRKQDKIIVISGESPVNKLGSLLVNKALAIINQNHISIECKKQTGLAERLNSGMLAKVEEHGSGKRRVLSGFLIDSTCTDPTAAVKTKSLGLRHGSIIEVSENTLRLSTSGGIIEIAISDILAIYSTCVYKFKLKLSSVAYNQYGQASAIAENMEFLPTHANSAVLSEKLSSGVNVLAIAGGASMGLLAASSIAAIAIPIAILSRGTKTMKNTAIVLQSPFAAQSPSTSTSSSGPTTTP